MHVSSPVLVTMASLLAVVVVGALLLVVIPDEVGVGVDPAGGPLMRAWLPVLGV